MLINSPLPIDSCTGLDRTCTNMMIGSTGTVSTTETTFRVDINYGDGGVGRYYATGEWETFDEGVNLFVGDVVVDGDVTTQLRFVSNDQVGAWRVHSSANAEPGSKWAEAWQKDIGASSYELAFGGNYIVPASSPTPVDVPDSSSVSLLLGGAFAVGLLKMRKRK